MVCHGHVLVAQFHGRFGHLLERVCPVALLCMDMEVAPDIRSLERLRKSALLRGLYLAAHLAQLRRYPRKPYRGVDGLLFFTCYPLPVFPEDAVFADFKPHPLCPVPNRHIVRLGAGKVLECRTKGLFLKHPYVYLKPGLKYDRGLCLANRNDLPHLRVLYEMVHYGPRIAAGGEYVEVADSLLPTPVASGWDNVDYARDLFQPGNKRQGKRRYK